MVEAATGTVVGAIVNWIIAFAAMVLIRDRALAATVTVGACTVHSLVRGYAIRRWFAGRESVRKTGPAR